MKKHQWWLFTLWFLILVGTGGVAYDLVRQSGEAPAVTFVKAKYEQVRSGQDRDEQSRDDKKDKPKENEGCVEPADMEPGRDCMSDGLGNRLCWSEEEGFTTVGVPVLPCIEGFSDWIVCRRPDGKWYKMVKEFIVEEAEGNK